MVMFIKMDSENSESQETNSTSLVEDTLNISFEDISYTVRNGLLAGGRKNILDKVNGRFNAGELTAIVGQSGAGKSTLMNIIAGYTKPMGGRILVNNRDRNEMKFRRRSCYILQDNKVRDMLTVYESLTIAAELKLGNHVNKEGKQRRIEEIIKSLGLYETRDTKSGSLSGGEQKRLSIGLELVSDPHVIILDEPISGLDSSMSKQIVKLLNFLARQGRTIIVTLHQPSASLLTKVDKLYAVEGGRCAFNGSVSQLLPYFNELNLKCPEYNNPVDHLIETCAETCPNICKVEELIKKSQNGKSEEWSKREEDYENDKQNIDRHSCNDNLLSALPLPKDDPTRKILLSLKSTYPTSYWKQFTTLTRSSLLMSWRNPEHTGTTFGIHCCMALLMGMIYFNIGDKANFAIDNVKFLFFSLMFLMYTAFSSVTITFPEQIPVARREHFNRWYTTGAYYTSTLLSAIPTQTVCTLGYAIISYFLTGQPLEFKRFSGFTLTLLLASYVALCFGLLNGSMFDVKHGVIFGPFFILPFVVFSGFFIRYNDTPFFLKWLFHVSYLKHGFTGLTLSIFHFNRTKLSCPVTMEEFDYCHFAPPKAILQEYGFEEESFYTVIPALFGIACLVIICGYIILKIRLKCKW